MSGHEVASREAVVETLLVEYGSLREESLAALEHRMTATNFTFAALAVLIGAVISSGLGALVAGTVLVLVVPQLAKAGLLIWLGEYARSQRAGRHVAAIETRVNDLLGSEVLTWEGGLKSANVHMTYPYWAVASLLLGTGYVASFVGLVLLGEATMDETSMPVAAVVAPLSALTVVWEWVFHRYFMGRWRQARTG